MIFAGETNKDIMQLTKNIYLYCLVTAVEKMHNSLDK